MRIDSSLPMHVARAYGPPAANQVRPVDKPRPSTAGAGLLAGKVNRPVDFDAPAPQGVRPLGLRAGGEPTDVLPLYTRAADRVEAATSVRIGRELDVKG